MITRQMLLDEGYQVDKMLKHAFYILPDGTIWDGNVEYGSRTLDHREVEVFTETNRYDGERFWEEVFLIHGLMMLVPETLEIFAHPKQQLTDEQIEVSKIYIKRLKYNLVPFN